MQEYFMRSSLLLGEEALKRLKDKKVAIFGLGGVGSYVAEALARTGVGAFLLVDDDTVSKSNINRQLFALSSTVGKRKVDVAKERLLDINPLLKINVKGERYLPETAINFDLSDCDFIVDAVDTLEAKVSLVLMAQQLNIPIISSMGAGNRLRPDHFHLSSLDKTSVCPLAKRLRQALRRKGYNLKELMVVYSDEIPVQPDEKGQLLAQETEKSAKKPLGSLAFVTGAAGLLLSSGVIDILLQD